jgi:hypothetical protein
MEEISNKAKILLFIDAIAAFIFTFLYLIIPEIYASLIDPLVFDPYYWRAFGATLLVLGIFGLRAAFLGRKEQALFMFEIMILWSIAILLLNIWELIVLPLSPTYTETTWFDSILLIVLIVLNTIIYFQEKK